MTFAPGTRVRARPGDPDHHTRVPALRPRPRRRGRGVARASGRCPTTARAASCRRASRASTRCGSRPASLWGAGSHTVTVDLWESYLEVVAVSHEDLPVAARVRRLEERVIAAGLTTDDELDAILDEAARGRLTAQRRPHGGAGLDRPGVPRGAAGRRERRRRSSWARPRAATGCAPSRTPPSCTTSSSARCAPAIPCRCSAPRRAGTRASPTAPASYASRARCSRSSASPFRMTSRSRCGTPAPRRATWWFRDVPRVSSPRRSWPAS